MSHQRSGINFVISSISQSGMFKREREGGRESEIDFKWLSQVFFQICDNLKCFFFFFVKKKGKLHKTRVKTEIDRVQISYLYCVANVKGP
jgi:hypothetical protein